VSRNFKQKTIYAEFQRKIENKNKTKQKTHINPQSILQTLTYFTLKADDIPNKHTTSVHVVRVIDIFRVYIKT